MEKDTKVVSITDKELLAICNLSNLKMEFDNLENEELITENGVQKKILSNHTIYSLLNKEYNAINNGSIEERVFYKEKEENNKEKLKNFNFSFTTPSKIIF